MNARIAKLQQLLQEDNIDAAVYAASANLQYFLNDHSFVWQRTPETGGPELFPEAQSGHFLNRPDCILLVPAEGEPVLIMTYERSKDMLHVDMNKETCYYVVLGDTLGGHLHGKRIACGSSCREHLERILKEIDKSIEVFDGEHYGEKLRMIKDRGEIEKLRKAARFTDETMGWLLPRLRPGITPQEVEALIIERALEHGVGDLPFPPTCLCIRTDAPGSQELDGYPVRKPIEEGTSLAFDFGFVIDGYCSDFGRSFYCGKPEKSISDGYKALHEAHCYLLETIKPGMQMDMTYRTLYEVMERYGCGKYLRNYFDLGLMGHQIGIDVHERPWLHDKSGMVMCIEPKFWRPGKAYLRIEDMVLVTDSGCESLTKFDRERFEL